MVRVTVPIGLPSAAASIMMMRSAFCSGSSRMNPPVPPSRHSTFAGQRVRFNRANHMNANALIAHEDVAQAKHQRLSDCYLSRFSRSNFHPPMIDEIVPRPSM